MIKIVGANIRKYRKLKHLTIKELAYMCDITPSMISDYERGIVDTNITTLCLIAKKLEVSPSILFEMPEGEIDTYGDEFPS
jgi:transcriptional regulator with XRE-family HTH domain